MTEKLVTRYEFELLRKRVMNHTGYSRKMWGLNKRIDTLLLNQQMLRNDIKTLHLRIDKIKKRLIIGKDKGGGND